MIFPSCHGGNQFISLKLRKTDVITIALSLNPSKSGITKKRRKKTGHCFFVTFSSLLV